MTNVVLVIATVALLLARFFLCAAQVYLIGLT